MERVWITGGGTGIGRELALAYARRGAKVWISGRRLEVLQKVEQEAASCPGKIYCAPLDVTDQRACEQTWRDLLSESEGFERIILNAGDHKEMPVEQFSQTTVEHLMNVNFYGVTRLVEQVLPWMMKHGGQLAIVASLAGYRGLPLAAAYGASKGALINMTEAMRAELEGGPVDLRLINPGFVRTPLTDRNQFEMPSLIDADDAAKRIVEGLDSKRFEIRFPSMFAATLRLLSMLPYRLYFALIRKITSQ